MTLYVHEQDFRNLITITANQTVAATGVSESSVKRYRRQMKSGNPDTE